MKVVNKKEEIKPNKFVQLINKSDKLNKIAMILIVTEYLIVAAVLIGVIDNAPSYKVVPEYQEILYNEEINPVIKVHANYSITDEELIRKDVATMLLYSDSSLGTKNIKVVSGALLENGKMMYFTDRETTSTTTIYSTQIQNSKVLESEFKKIFIEIDYRYTNQNGEVVNKSVELSEKMIQLTKADMAREQVNEITNAKYYIETEEGKEQKSIFTSFKCKATLQSDKKNYTISSSFTVSTDASKKSHLDIQFFAVNGKEVYDLAGFYNVSNTVKRSQEQTITFPKGEKIEYVYVKGTYVTENGEKIELFYKERFENIIK